MFDLPHLIQTYSYLGLFLILFAESGLLAGFFLPGDSLLITAGLLARPGSLDGQNLNLGLVILACTLGAAIGDNVGYWIGRRFGKTVFSRSENKFLNPKQIEKTQAFFKKHGPKAIIFARFIPVVRTISPTMAGVAEMPYSKFLVYDLIGVVLWAAGVPLLGYLLGGLIPNLDHYILLVVGLVLVVSFIPVARELWLSRQEKVKS